MYWGIDMEEFLKTLLSSLNSIEVKGKDNIDILLGCILAVEKMQETLTKEVGEDG